MEYFKNKAESFFREIRKIEIYEASVVSYESNFNNQFPNPAAALKIFEIIPETFTRKIPTKKSAGNYYYDVDLGFPLLDMTEENVNQLYDDFNRQGFAVVLVSNFQKTLLGNKRFPLTIEVLDNINDDASGNDEFSISITGDTILAPKFVLI